MINYENKELFRQDSVNKQWTIEFTNIVNGERIPVATIHNEDILDESIKITETLSSDGLNFGRCEPNKIELTIYNVYGRLKGCEMKVYVSLNGEPNFSIGTYIVDTDVPTADRFHRKIEAFDFLNDINNRDVAAWYDSIQFPVTIKTLRDNFFSYLGYEQVDTTLVNDNITIQKTVDSEGGVSGGSVLSAICETNGVFGHVTRDNKFRYIKLSEIYKGKYPKDDLYPANDVYPSNDLVDTVYTKDEWSSLTYEEYECKGIDGVYVIDSYGEIYASSGECLNGYELKQNFLLYEMEDGSTEDAKNRKIRNSIVQTASGFIGRTYDSKNNIIFVTDYYGKEQNKRVDYCCIFVWDIFRMCNASEYFYAGKKTSSCTTLLDYYRTYFPDRVHTNISRCKPGDLVFYQLDTDAKADHVGIFESASDDTHFYAVEGNTTYSLSGGQTNKGYVARRNRNINKVMAFVSVNFPEDTLKPSILQEVCDNLYSQIKGLSYRPFSMEVIADPCVEVGDRLRTNSNDQIVYTYCMQRTMTGVQFMSDIIDSFGVEDRSDNVTSVSDDLKRLKEKVRKDAVFNDVKLRTLEASTVTISNHLSAAEADITKLYTSDVQISGRIDAVSADLSGDINSLGTTLRGEFAAADLKLSGRIDASDLLIEGLKTDYATISKGLGTAENDIITVRKVAVDAGTAAGNAQSTANSASNTASAAQSTADSANTAAGNAQKTANGAQSDATKALKEIVTIQANFVKTDALKSKIAELGGLDVSGGVFITGGTVVVNDKAYATSTLTINSKTYNIVTWSAL